MRFTFLIALLFPLFTSADESSFILCQKNHRLIFVSDDPERHYYGNLEPYWSWEGKQTSATFTVQKTGLHIFWSIDIIGPYFYHLDLDDSDKGLTVSLVHTGKACEPDISYTYDNYDHLLHSDDPLAYAVKIMMERSGCGSVVHDVTFLRYVLFNVMPPANPEKEKKCALLIQKLDSELFSEREKASRELAKAENIIYVNKLAHNLTLEQKSRVNYAKFDYFFDETLENLELLAKVCDVKFDSKMFEDR